MLNIINKQAVGERIRNLRKEKGFNSQDELAEKMMCKRQTVAKWERGETSLSLESAIDLCNVLDCDIGHLMGEYEAKRHKTADIQEILGISEKAAYNLQLLSVMKSGLNRTHQKYTGIDFINDLISEDDFLYLVSLCLSAREIFLNELLSGSEEKSELERRLDASNIRMNIIEGKGITLSPREYSEYTKQAISKLASSVISIAILQGCGGESIAETIHTVDEINMQKRREDATKIDADTYMKALMGYRSEKTTNQKEP